MLAILRTNVSSECLKHYAVRLPLSQLSSVLSLKNTCSEAQCQFWSKGKVSLNNSKFLHWNSRHKVHSELCKTNTNKEVNKTIIFICIKWNVFIFLLFAFSRSVITACYRPSRENNYVWACPLYRTWAHPHNYVFKEVAQGYENLATVTSHCTTRTHARWCRHVASADSCSQPLTATSSCLAQS